MHYMLLCGFCMVALWILLTTCFCFWWLVWYCGYGIVHICKVKLRRARLVLGLVTFGKCTVPVFTHLSPFGLAIAPWVSAL